VIGRAARPADGGRFAFDCRSISWLGKAMGADAADHSRFESTAFSTCTDLDDCKAKFKWAKLRADLTDADIAKVR